MNNKTRIDRELKNRKESGAYHYLVGYLRSFSSRLEDGIYETRGYTHKDIAEHIISSLETAKRFAE